MSLEPSNERGHEQAAVVVEVEYPLTLYPVSVSRESVVSPHEATLLSIDDEYLFPVWDCLCLYAIDTALEHSGPAAGTGEEGDKGHKPIF